MIQRLHLGLDLDGTLADHTQAKLFIARALGHVFKPHHTPSEVLRHLMSPQEYGALQTRLYTEFVDNAPKVAGVSEALEEMRRRGWEFSLVSRRWENGHESARKWLSRELPGFIPPERVFFVTADDEKEIICKRENILAFVDDQQGVLNYLESVQCRILHDPHGSFISALPEYFVGMRKWHELPYILSRFE